MLKLSGAILLLAALAAPAAAESPLTVPQAAPEPECLGGPYQAAACLDRRLAELAPCTGSVEERLACLDGRLRAQAEQIAALRRQLFEQTRPRVSPLVGNERF